MGKKPQSKGQRVGEKMQRKAGNLFSKNKSPQFQGLYLVFNGNRP
jgi:hypothetical protein